MKKITIILFLLCAAVFTQAQRPTQILADTVILYSNNAAKGSTLQIKNLTKDTLGFLYNTGNGKTIFKRAAIKLNDSTYVIGADTIKIKTLATALTLQQVTDYGNTTTNDITINNLYANAGISTTQISSGDYLIRTMTSNGFADSLRGYIQGDSLSNTDLHWQLPDSSGTFVLSINGNKPDKYGNVTGLFGGGGSGTDTITNAGFSMSKTILANAITLNFDSSTGFHTQNYNDLRYGSLSQQNANIAAIAQRVLYTDTASMLSPYMRKANNLSDLTNANTALTNLGISTLGKNFITDFSTNASPTYLKRNADNSLAWLDAASFRTDIGAGTGSGTVTAIGVTTANGVSGTSSGGATPNLTISLGAITPTSTNGVSAATMAYMDATSSIQGQLNNKVNISDTASMLSKYLRKIDTTGKWQPVGSYLTSETDPVVKAINGLVKSNGTTISAATAGTDYLTPTGNGSGLTGFTSGQITTALGFTPYNSTNPSGYITNATGLISAGTNVTITGSGTSGSPYVINSSGSGGSSTGIDSSLAQNQSLSANREINLNGHSFNITDATDIPTGIRFANDGTTRLGDWNGAVSGVTLDVVGSTGKAYFHNNSNNFKLKINSTSTPDSTVDIDGSIKATGGIRFTGLIQNATLDTTTKKIVVADANGVLSKSYWPTGGGGSTNIGNTNLALSSNRFLDLSSYNFEVYNMNTEAGLYLDYTNSRTTLGDKLGNFSGALLTIEANKAYVKNTGNTIKFGINNATPAAELDLVGDAKMLFNNGSNGVGKFLQDVDGAGNLEFADVPTYVGAGAGLVPATSGGIGDFYLKQDGTWATVSASLANGDKGDVVVAGGGSTLTVESVSGELNLKGITSPATYTSDQTNVAYTGSSIIRVNSNSDSRLITSISGGTDGRIIKIVNVGATDIVLQNDDGSTGTAANRFEFNGVDVVIEPKEGRLLEYDATLQRWVKVAYEYDLNNLRRQPMHEWDYEALGVATANFPTTAIASGTAAYINTQAEHPGVLTTTSSATTNSGHHSYYLGVGTLYYFQGGEIYECVYQPKVASNTNTTTRFGFLDATTSADAVDGAYFEIPAGSFDVVGKTSNNSTRTTSSTIATIAVNTWYRFVIKVNRAASSISFTIYDANGVSLGTQSNTTNIPNTSVRVFGVGYVSTNVGTSATLLGWLDRQAFQLGAGKPLNR